MSRLPEASARSGVRLPIVQCQPQAPLNSLDSNQGMVCTKMRGRVRVSGASAAWMPDNGIPRSSQTQTNQDPHLFGPGIEAPRGKRCRTEEVLAGDVPET